MFTHGRMIPITNEFWQHGMVASGPFSLTPALSRWERGRRSQRSSSECGQHFDGGRSLSLSQRERAGVREKSCVRRKSVEGLCEMA